MSKKINKENIKSVFSSSNNIVLAKCFALLVVLVIVMCYAISFAMNSKNYTANKISSDILNSDLLYTGASVGEVYVGGLDKSQAVEVAQALYADKRLDKYNITFKTDYGYNKTFTYKELGGKYDVEKAVNQAYKVGRSGSKNDRLAELDNIKDKGSFANATYSIDESTLKDTLSQVVDEVNKEYKMMNKEADFDRTYKTTYDNMQTQQTDIEIYVSEK